MSKLQNLLKSCLTRTNLQQLQRHQREVEERLVGCQSILHRCLANAKNQMAFMPRAMLCQAMELYFMKLFVISCKLLNPFNSCSELLIVINPYLFLKLIINSTFNADWPFLAAIIKFHTMSIVNPSFFPHELCCKNYEIRKSGNLVIPWIPDFLEMFFWLMELELEHSIIIKKCQSIFWFSEFLHSTK